MRANCIWNLVLEEACRSSWTIDAVQYDAEQAARRAEILAEEERKQAQQDIQLLAETIRGSVGVAAVVLNSFVDSQTGALRRQDAGLRDAAALLKVALDALHVVLPEQLRKMAQGHRLCHKCCPG
jgi:hypothetical protein